MPVLSQASNGAGGNAVSFSPPGGSVQVRARRLGSRIEVHVDDHGPGVPPHLLDRIFERHVSIRPERDDAAAGQANFGIGLWICRRHLAAHGGTIEAQNRPEGGLRMCVALPSAGQTGS